jgi:uncharacterized protein (TIGR02001 family)
MKLLQTTAIAGLLVASGAASALELSGNVALTTDYVWRGMSQTDGAPAIQGGFDADLGNGLYAGVWASNVDFGSDSSVEVDVYAGWAGQVAGFDLDVGVLHYAYPTGENGLDFTEVYIGTTIELPVLGAVAIQHSIGVDTGDDTTGDVVYGDYTSAGFDLGEHYGLALSASAGFYNVDGGEDVTDWKVSASKSMFGVDLDVSYTDTDGAGSEDMVVLTVSKSL